MKPSRSNYSNSFPSNVTSACPMNTDFMICRHIIGDLLSLKSKVRPQKGKSAKKGEEQNIIHMEIEVIIVFMDPCIESATNP